MQSHVERLLPCLLTCFRDDSWPVRDGEGVYSRRALFLFDTYLFTAACVACGNFVKCFPQDSRSVNRGSIISAGDRLSLGLSWTNYITCFLIISPTEFRPFVRAPLSLWRTSSKHTVLRQGYPYVF